jgi:hypothetical protein
MQKFRRSLLSPLAAMTLLLPAAAHATAVRGPIPWDFLVCKFSDTTSVPLTISQVQTKLNGSGVGSLGDWIGSVSNGKASLSAITVHGYYTVPITGAAAVAAENAGRGAIYKACLAAAEKSTGTGLTAPFTTTTGHGLTVLTSPSIDEYGATGYSMDGVGDPVGEFAHEFGHGLNLNHSWTNDYYSYLPPGAGGDYGNPWDTMSYGRVTDATSSPQTTYDGGPGLDAYHMDALGWIPLSRILNVGAGGVQTQTVTLAPLNHPERTGYLLVRVPISAADPFHYLTVEYETNDGWYSGIPGQQILINEVVQPSVADLRAFPSFTGGWPSYYTTYLQRAPSTSQGANDGLPLQSENIFGTKIALQGTPGDTASVTATAGYLNAAIFGPNTCADPYVWRQADDSDYVCVTLAARQQATNDNAAAGSRTLPNSQTCKTGFVWRQAFPGDLVCVTPATKTATSSDNAAAVSRYLKSNT